MVEPLTWKGQPIMKTPADLTLYQMLLWELKPDNIIDLGTWNGATLDYLKTMCISFGLYPNIYSFDIENKESNYYADNNDLNTYRQYEHIFRNLKGKTLLIEDSHVNWVNVVDYIFEFLKPEDYIIVEDIANRDAKKFQEFMSFYVKRKSEVLLDNKYINYFGPENTTCGVGILKKTVESN
jgi:cephalosporin hydroxylase